jgi:hypothetical protein
VTAIEPPAEIVTPLALAAIPGAEAKADALPPDFATAAAAKPADEPRVAVRRRS